MKPEPVQVPTKQEGAGTPEVMEEDDQEQEDEEEDGEELSVVPLLAYFQLVQANEDPIDSLLRRS